MLNKPEPLIDGDYDDEYVTTCSSDSRTVVSSSKSAVAAYNEAKAKGCVDPVLIYVPPKDAIFIF